MQSVEFGCSGITPPHAQPNHPENNAKSVPKNGSQTWPPIDQPSASRHSNVANSCPFRPRHRAPSESTFRASKRVRKYRRKRPAKSPKHPKKSLRNARRRPSHQPPRAAASNIHLTHRLARPSAPHNPRLRTPLTPSGHTPSRIFRERAAIPHAVNRLKPDQKSKTPRASGHLI